VNDAEDANREQSEPGLEIEGRSAPRRTPRAGSKTAEISRHHQPMGEWSYSAWWRWARFALVSREDPNQLVVKACW